MHDNDVRIASRLHAKLSYDSKKTYKEGKDHPVKHIHHKRIKSTALFNLPSPTQYIQGLTLSRIVKKRKSIPV